MTVNFIFHKKNSNKPEKEAVTNFVLLSHTRNTSGCTKTYLHSPIMILYFLHLNSKLAKFKHIKHIQIVLVFSTIHHP